MKQYKINGAFAALNKIMLMEMPIKEARAVFMLRRSLEAPYEFELEREKALIAKYSATMLPSGALAFPDDESAARFKEEIDEMNQSDVEIDIKPIRISAECLSGDKITPACLAALEGFIDFE